MNLPSLPVFRWGQPYESLDQLELSACGDGRKLLAVSQANAGLIRRDLAKVGAAFEVLQALSCEKLLAICAKAGALFMHEALPLGNGVRQSPEEFVECLSATGGLPQVMVRRNMAKIHQVFTEMPVILKGLTRGLDLRVLDAGHGEQAGVPVSFFPATQALGVVLPSNSPGVNSLWMPALALKIPVLLKPGREDPWTPWRIVQAFLAAGAPAEAFGFYPTGHEGAGAILQGCGRALLFGDESTTAPYASNPAIQIHGPGRSKVLIGADEIERWTEHLDVLVESILANGGRSCINASAIVVPAHGREIAAALALRLGPLGPCAATDESAQLAGFANPRMAESIEAVLEEGLRTPGAEEATAAHRQGPRKVEKDGITFLRPTVIRCGSFAHPLANREFLFPYASVVEIPQERMLEQIGPSLVVTAITRDPKFIRQLLASPLIGRLNLGALPTTRVSWDQPHEGNLFEFLYRRRAIQSAHNASRSANNANPRE